MIEVFKGPDMVAVRELADNAASLLPLGPTRDTDSNDGYETYVSSDGIEYVAVDTDSWIENRTDGVEEKLTASIQKACANRAELQTGEGAYPNVDTACRWIDRLVAVRAGSFGLYGESFNARNAVIVTGNHDSYLTRDLIFVQFSIDPADTEKDHPYGDFVAVFDGWPYIHGDWTIYNDIADEGGWYEVDGYDIYCTRCHLHLYGEGWDSWDTDNLIQWGNAYVYRSGAFDIEEDMSELDGNAIHTGMAVVTITYDGRTHTVQSQISCGGILQAQPKGMV